MFRIAEFVPVTTSTAFLASSEAPLKLVKV